MPRLAELFRFYQAAIVNTLFGFGVYALLVWSGLNIYLAQIIAHAMGVTFNYFTYSRHVFREREGGKLKFVAAYGLNYLVNAALLTALAPLVRSPYAAGALATLGASLLNYLALRRLVFARRQA